jgi:hypothetical protein
MGLVYVNRDQRDDTRNNATHLLYFLKLTRKYTSYSSTSGRHCRIYLSIQDHATTGTHLDGEGLAGFLPVGIQPPPMMSSHSPSAW